MNVGESSGGGGGGGTAQAAAASSTSGQQFGDYNKGGAALGTGLIVVAVAGLFILGLAALVVAAKKEK